MKHSTAEHDAARTCSEPCAISFLISTYNRAPYVEACVKHLLSIQTPHLIEVIVRDNGSDDNTKSVIEAIDDQRLRYVRSPENQGTISFLEVGRLARGEVITWLSDEDDFEFEHLDYVIDTFRSHPTCSVLIGSITVGPHSTEVIFPEKVTTNHEDALVSTMQFSGCGGVFVRGGLFRLNCNIYLANQHEAYKIWNYYPIGFFATACLEQELINTSKVVVRQARQAPTTNNWSEIGDARGTKTMLSPHYYPESIFDRLCSNLVNAFGKRNLSLREKLRIANRLAASFRHQIDAILHPSLIKLLHDNYSKSVVDMYERHIHEKRLHLFRIRRLWIGCKLLSMPLCFIALCWQLKRRPYFSLKATNHRWES